MQHKKEEVRQRILAAAREEYLKRGYRGANIVEIAEKAEVPVGNLYRYFEGKTGVLDAIVAPVYNEVPRLLRELSDIRVLDSLTLQEFMPMLSGKLLEFFERFGTDLLILTEGCEGTRYEDFAADIGRQITAVIRRKLYPDTTDETEIHFSGILAKAFCGALFDILRYGTDKESMRQLAEKLLLFFFFEVDKRK